MSVPDAALSTVAAWKTFHTRLQGAEGVTFGNKHVSSRIKGQRKRKPCQHRRICTQNPHIHPDEPTWK